MNMKRFALISVVSLAGAGALASSRNVQADPAEECREGCDAEEIRETEAPIEEAIREDSSSSESEAEAEC